MAIESLEELAEGMDYSFRLMKDALRSADGIRLYLSITKDLQLRHDEVGHVSLVSIDDEYETWLGGFENDNQAAEFMKLVTKVRRELLSIRHDLNEADYEGEYEQMSSIARSKVFNTNLVVKAVNRISEQVATGLDDPEHRIRIMDDLRS